MTDLVVKTDLDVEAARTALMQKGSRRRRIAEKFFMAALGSIPWVGGFISAAASIPGDEKSERDETLQSKWLAANQERLDELGKTLGQIESRLDTLGPEVEDRLQNESYLTLVRRSFRAWDRA